MDKKVIKPEMSSKERSIGKTVTPMLPAGFFKDWTDMGKRGIKQIKTIR